MQQLLKRRAFRWSAATVCGALALSAVVAASPWREEPEASYTLPEGFEYDSDPDYYTEKYRPQYHLSPETANMSDPNGMVYFEGEYHQMYQRSGQWGHAISKDLLHWEHRPLALPKDELGDIWSGSAVVDRHDTTGFFGGKPGLVAIFTHFKNGLQSQSIAYSADKGRTWTKYEGNPVIPNPGVKDFRDPKVFWHEASGKWVMIVSVDKKVWFYRSPDLKRWEWTGEFGPGHGSHAAVWECPDLFELPIEGTSEKRWVLTVSLGNNTQTKGSKAQYFVGTFDGNTFKNDNLPAVKLWTDHGKDFYAAISYSDIPEEDGRRIWLGWMSNWRYPFAMPTGVWKGNMSIPRELRLRDVPGEGLRLVQEPIEELKRLRGEGKTLKNVKLKAGENPFEALRGASFETEATFRAEAGSGGVFGFKVRTGEEQETVIGYDAAAQELFLDRTRSGEASFEANFAERMTAPLPLRGGTLKLRVFVDDTTVEVFANDGEAVMSAIIFPDPLSRGLELFADASASGVVVERAAFYPMRTVWRDEDPDDERPRRILVSHTILHLKEEEAVPLRSAVLPHAADQGIEWTSTDPAIVDVQPNEDGGIVATGKLEGSAELLARTADGTVERSINVFVEGE
ncbi:GH32 C-terminal domain-containing protein [Paenibacillus sp.]|uniref:GH32 C-terminal domain-containing protein n=1 Tax=Paenibacillus sp. TaxID=58172 RepID=UPI002811267B|nr:GH32 C-terminal domain-containing protein [Paenibacillus sp.]